ncbi:uncharacterized protein LOC144452858 [Glandiceps talaboti]
MDSKIGRCWRCGQEGRIQCDKCQFALYCRKTCMYEDKYRHKMECIHGEKRKKCHHCQKITTVRQCGGCLSVWYCGSECQGKNWPSHKTQCLKIKNDIITIAKTSKGSFWRITPKIKPRIQMNVYYWGNTPAVDLLNLEQNEWSSGYYPDKLALLLAGVGDLRNVIKTGASLPMQFKGQVAFYLNDFDPNVIARIVLFLYMLCTCDEVSEMAETLVQLWYSTSLTIRNGKVLEDHLEELVKVNGDTILRKTRGMIVISENNLKAVKPIWYDWLKISKQGGPRYHILTQRSLWMHAEVDIEQKYSDYLCSVPEQHRQSLAEWKEDGILLTTTNPEKSEATVQNVTLLRRNPICEFYTEYDVRIQNPGQTERSLDFPDWFKREPYTYGISPMSFPFSGWDYVEASLYCDVPCLQTMFANYISHVIEEFTKKVQDSRCVFHIFVEDCFKLKTDLRKEQIYFDRITTSNLADYYSIPVILDFFKSFMNTINPHSLLVTEMMNWYEVVKALNLGPIFHIGDEVSPTYNWMADVASDTGISPMDAGFYSRCETTMEYEDYIPSFLKYLRADFYQHNKKDTGNQPRRKNIPKISEVYNYDGWKLRDFTRELNCVIPHKWRRNIRQVTRIYGVERNLEWTIIDN